MRTRSHLLVLALILVGMVAVGCVQQSDTPTAKPPPPPEILSELPVNVKSECSADPRYDAARMTLWEYPGTDIVVDSDSDVGAYRGDPMGYIQGCEQVIVTDFAWSEDDEEYYVNVHSQDQEGWIALSVIRFTPTGDESSEDRP